FRLTRVDAVDVVDDVVRALAIRVLHRQFPSGRTDLRALHDVLDSGEPQRGADAVELRFRRALRDRHHRGDSTCGDNRAVRRFDHFINSLARAEVSERACNQYSSTVGETRANAIRRRNLRLYLEQLDAIGALILMIGEAPSYRGGRLTGIPFVSETVMLRGVETRSG